MNTQHLLRVTLNLSLQEYEGVQPIRKEHFRIMILLPNCLEMEACSSNTCFRAWRGIEVIHHNTTLSNPQNFVQIWGQQITAICSRLSDWMSVNCVLVFVTFTLITLMSRVEYQHKAIKHFKNHIAILVTVRLVQIYIQGLHWWLPIESRSSSARLIASACRGADIFHSYMSLEGRIPNRSGA